MPAQTEKVVAMRRHQLARQLATHRGAPSRALAVHGALAPKRAAPFSSAAALPRWMQLAGVAAVGHRARVSHGLTDVINGTGYLEMATPLSDLQASLLFFLKLAAPALLGPRVRLPRPYPTLWPKVYEAMRIMGHNYIGCQGLSWRLRTIQATTA